MHCIGRFRFCFGLLRRAPPLAVLRPCCLATHALLVRMIAGWSGQASSPVPEEQHVRLDYALDVEVTHAGVEWQALELDFVQVEDFA